jgi:hypothetical protein
MTDTDNGQCNRHKQKQQLIVGQNDHVSPLSKISHYGNNYVLLEKLISIIIKWRWIYFPRPEGLKEITPS